MTNKFAYNFTPENNGGESIYFTCTYEEIGLPSEEISLNSYCSCASFNTSGVFTSDNFFKLAIELQKFEIEQQLKSTSKD